MNKEEESYRKERIVDINLVIKLMSDFDIDNDYFTEKGQGYLQGLASKTDEVKFLSYLEHDKIISKLDKKIDAYKRNTELNLNKQVELQREIDKLKSKLSKRKPLASKWF